LSTTPTPSQPSSDITTPVSPSPYYEEPVREIPSATETSSVPLIVRTTTPPSRANQQRSLLGRITSGVSRISPQDRAVIEKGTVAVSSAVGLAALGALALQAPLAAKKVNEIYSNPTKWWNSENVQKAKNEFCFMYARPSLDWKKDWVQYIQVKLNEATN
jgi:hypothetical protein